MNLHHCIAYEGGKRARYVYRSSKMNFKVVFFFCAAGLLLGEGFKACLDSL